MRIYIHLFGADSFSFGGIEDVISDIRDIVAEQDRLELRRIAAEFPVIPRPIITAGYLELKAKDTRDQLIRISAIKEGSLDVWLAVGAFSLWFLEKTMGETLKEAWKEAELNKRIKRYLLTNAKVKMRAIQQLINSRIERPEVRNSRRGFSLQVRMHASFDEGSGELSIRVNCSHENDDRRRIPTYDEISKEI